MSIFLPLYSNCSMPFLKLNIYTSYIHNIPPAGASLDLSQPAAALQSQKVQPAAVPLLPQNNSIQAAAAPQKQVRTKTHSLNYCPHYRPFKVTSNVCVTASGAGRDSGSTRSRGASGRS